MYIIASAIGTTPPSKEGGLPLFEIKKGQNRLPFILRIIEPKS